MTKNTAMVRGTKGLDATPIAMVVQEAGNFTSQIYIEMGTKKINAKSIMGMMSLTLSPGQELVIVAEGSDEEAASKRLAEYIEELCL